MVRPTLAIGATDTPTAGIDTAGAYLSKYSGVTPEYLNPNLGSELSVCGPTVPPFGDGWLGTDHGNFRLHE